MKKIKELILANKFIKIALDLIFGAVIPIIILNNSGSNVILGYVIASLIPVSWVFIDLVFLTKSFNIITTLAATYAIKDLFLTFWFVDGLLFAIKDSSVFIISIIIYGASIIIGKPIMKYLVYQTLVPKNDKQKSELDDQLSLVNVKKELYKSTFYILLAYLVLGIANFYLNLEIVIAKFGTEDFNVQVAEVNAITRLFAPIFSIAIFAFAYYKVYNQLITPFKSLIKDEESVWEIDFWELIDRNENNEYDK